MLKPILAVHVFAAAHTGTTHCAGRNQYAKRYDNKRRVNA